MVKKALSYIYPTNQNQCVRINDKKSNFQKIITDVPQRLRISFREMILFFLVSNVSMYNFPDYNTLPAIVKTVRELKNTLQSESEVVINWFKNNEMIVNPEKFQAIILDKQKHENLIIKQLRLFLLSDSLGVQLDDKLDFNLNVSNICKSALIRLNYFSCFEVKKALIYIYFTSNFNYCPLIRMLSNATSLKKIENLQKRALRFLHNN